MEYLHPDNRDKPYVDWREPKNRLPMCVRSYVWRMKHRDVDHYTYNEAYMSAKGKKSPTGKVMTPEQRIYFALLFGITYQSSMAWTIYWHFPNLEKIDFKELEKWNDDNYARQQFAKDTKYNKGKFIPILKDIQAKALDKYGSLSTWVGSFADFEDAFLKVTDIHKIGRMSGWLTTQAMYELCGARNITPKDMLATDPSNWSVRSGLAFVFNREDLMDLDGKRKYTAEETKDILKFEQHFINACEEAMPLSDPFFSPFTLETHLCQYKKMICRGGDAPGTPTQDAYTRWYKLKQAWPEVDYSAYESILGHAAPVVQRTFQNKMLMKTGALTGQMINMHEDNPDLPDMYKEFGIDPNDLRDFDKIGDKSITQKVEEYCSKMDSNSDDLSKFAH